MEEIKMSLFNGLFVYVIVMIVIESIDAILPMFSDDAIVTLAIFLGVATAIFSMMRSK